jgi:hypothetical protein
MHSWDKETDRVLVKVSCFTGCPITLRFFNVSLSSQLSASKTDSIYATVMKLFFDYKFSTFLLAKLRSRMPTIMSLLFTCRVRRTECEGADPDFRTTWNHSRPIMMVYQS